MEHDIWLILFGFLVGVFGTMIGAGGGFILTPVLLLFYTHDSTDTITSISLAVTFANAFSGSIAYARMKRINYKYGLIFSAAAVPGAVLGAMATYYVRRSVFDPIFGAVLLVVATVIFVKPPREKEADGNGDVHLSRRSLLLGIAISAGVGLVSSFLGIGGGIVHVPALSTVLGFPVHTATATSHFILAIVTAIGVLVHIATGTFQHGVVRTAFLATGVLLGAQLGALISSKVEGKAIIRVLAVALAIVGVRLLYLSVAPN
jgi:uncharacterized membrane protein YfcA